MIQLSEFWASEYGQQALETIRLRGSSYWAENVYKYYNRDTGSLGQACQIELVNDNVVAVLKPIYSMQRDGTIHEYGQDIMEGIRPGPGKYNPVKGVRERSGYYPGVSVHKFWEPWMAEFEPALAGIVREEVTLRLGDFIREQFVGGVSNEHNV